MEICEETDRSGCFESLSDGNESLRLVMVTGISLVRSFMRTCRWTQVFAGQRASIPPHCTKWQPLGHRVHSIWLKAIASHRNARLVTQSPAVLTIWLIPSHVNIWANWSICLWYRGEFFSSPANCKQINFCHRIHHSCAFGLSLDGEISIQKGGEKEGRKHLAVRRNSFFLSSRLARSLAFFTSIRNQIRVISGSHYFPGTSQSFNCVVTLINVFSFAKNRRLDSSATVVRAANQSCTRICIKIYRNPLSSGVLHFFFLSRLGAGVLWERLPSVFIMHTELCQFNDSSSVEQKRKWARWLLAFFRVAAWLIAYEMKFNKKAKREDERKMLIPEEAR